MRIALRTSGGRGEYELVGSQGKISSSDLFDREIILELAPGNLMPTSNFPRNIQGKPRIRLGEPGGSHAYLPISGALLLAKPKRELGETNQGALQIVDNGYSITSIYFDVVNLDSGSVVVRPTNLVASNFGNQHARIDVIERMSHVFDLWTAAENSEASDEKSLLLDHRDAFLAGNASFVEKAARKLRVLIDSDEDPLKQLLRRFGISSEDTLILGIHRGSIETSMVVSTADEDHRSAYEATQDIVRRWRHLKLRGPAVDKFRREVREAYGYTCMFTGYHLPPTPVTRSAGVDAAHILPWARNNINDVQNRICLSKLCHWAFDAGVLRLNYDNSTGGYVLTIPKLIKEVAEKGLFDVSPFQDLVGVIPVSRLPSNDALWPDPVLIKRFNQDASA